MGEAFQYKTVLSTPLSYTLQTTLNGFYIFTETIHTEPPIITIHKMPYLAPLDSHSSGTGAPLDEKTIFDIWLNGYSFPSEAPTSRPPRVAFTLKSSSVKGGGPMMVYRYAEWLVRLGVQVTIYSDDVLPDWLELTANFRHYNNETERYAAITEPVVIVYSVQKLPDLLGYCSTSGKRIYHFCQGVEDYQYIPPPDKELIIPVPVFDILKGGSHLAPPELH